MDNLNNNGLNDLQASSDNLSSSVSGLNDLLDALNKKQMALAASFQQNTKAFKDNADNIQATGDAIKDINDQLDKNAKMLSTGTASLQQNKASLADLLAQYNNLTKSQSDNSDGAKKLNTQIGQLSATVADQEKKLAKSREVFDFHKGSTDQLKTSFESLKGSAGSFSSVLEDSAKGFNAMKSGLSVAKTGLQGVGSAVKATGFGLLMTVLQSVTSYFTETTAGTKKLQQILAAIGVVTDTVTQAFASLGGIIVDTFTHPIESLKQLGSMIMENFINRFKAVLVIWDGLKKLDFKQVTNGVLQATTGVTNLADKAGAAYKAVVKGAVGMGNKITKAYDEAGNAAEKHGSKIKQVHTTVAGGSAVIKKVADDTKQSIEDIKQATLQADQDIQDSKVRLARSAMDELEKELNDVDKFYDDKLKAYQEYLDKYDAMDPDKQKANKELHDKTAEAKGQLSGEQQDARLKVLDDFNKAYADKIKQGQSEIAELNDRSQMTEIQRKIDALNKQQKLVEKSLDNDAKAITDANIKDRKDLDDAVLSENPNQNEIDKLQKNLDNEIALEKILKDKKTASAKKTEEEIDKIKKDASAKELADAKQKESQKKDFAIQIAQQISGTAFSIIKNSISSSSDAKIKSLEQDKAAELSNTSLTTTQKKAIEDKYKAKEAQEKAKAFKEQQLVSISQAVINGALAITKVTAQSGVLAPLVIPGIIAETAIQIATIAAQKVPKFAKGGQFVSDGRGALLPGYSRTDNTNAYLRSGEAVVVSEAMRNPWARNLVSAINVAHGGRDFALPNTGRGYAVGGIFTDGGNANRYYSQPVNDQKDLANTIAYQMINNFPPIYVDVKDVNNQQNILAQTINRVNL